MIGIVGVTGMSVKFEQIGKLFKGEPKQTKKNADGKEYQTFGRELDYWRFESDIPAVKEVFHKAFGDKPREIPCYLPFPTVDQNLMICKEAYTHGGLQHRCNGQECVLWFDPKANDYKTTPVPCPTLVMDDQDRKRNGCKGLARLNVFIPALGAIGFVTMETHSINDILFLDSCLPGYASLPGAVLNKIPMSLYRYQKEISTPRDGKRVRVSKWLVGIRPDGEWAGKYLSAQSQMMLSQSFEQLALNPAEETEEEIEEETVHEGIVEPLPATPKTTPAFDRKKTIAAIYEGFSKIREEFKVSAEDVEKRIAQAAGGQVGELEEMEDEQLDAILVSLRGWFKELKAAKGGK